MISMDEQSTSDLRTLRNPDKTTDESEKLQLAQQMVIGRDTINNSSTSDAFWNLVKCFVGASSFALPWSVSKVGVLLAFLIFVFIAVFMYFTYRWLLIASHHIPGNRNPTYPQLGSSLFNKLFNTHRARQSTSWAADGHAHDAISTEASTDSQDSSISTTTNALQRHFRDNNNADNHANCWTVMGKILVYIPLGIEMTGACAEYVLFISSAMADWLHLDHKICATLLLPLFIGLVCIRDYRYLAHTAKFGVFSVLAALFITMYNGILKIPDYDTLQNKWNNMQWTNAENIPVFVGSVCFLFIIHPTALSQEQSMKDRDTNDNQHTVSKQFKKALNMSCAFITILNLVFSEFVYMSFNEVDTAQRDEHEFKDNIIDALESGTLKDFTKVMLCVDLLLTYAIIMYPFAEALDAEIFDVSQLNTTAVIVKGNLIRILFVMLTALVAVCMPFFGYLSALTGGSSSMLLGFMFPPVLVWVFAKEEVSKFELYVLCPISFLFGTVMLVWSPYTILKQSF